VLDFFLKPSVKAAQVVMTKLNETISAATTNVNDSDIASPAKAPNVALERLAQTTTNKGSSQASPLQAQVRLR